MTFKLMHRKPTVDHFRSAIRDYQQLSFLHRSPKDDFALFKDELAAKSVKADSYKYLHWSLADAIYQPDFYLSQILLYHSQFLLYRAKVNDVKTGDVLLRVVEYSEQVAFGTHIDSGYLSSKIATIKDDEVAMHFSDYYGYQAELIHGSENPTYHPLYHKFNSDKGDFSFIIFVNAHFSTPVCSDCQYPNIGEFLNSEYYRREANDKIMAS